MNLIKITRAFVGSAIIAAGLLTLSAPANATFVFSNVSHTANSLTFTINGDMSGYTNTGDNTQFSIRLLGDIYAGPSSGATANSWSSSPFDNKSFAGGNLYEAPGTAAYIWSEFGNLSDAFSTSNTVTVSWSQNWLNTAATDPTMQFVWGNGNNASRYTILATTVEGAAVPEPVSLALLGLGLAGIGFSRRKKQQAA